MNVVVAYSSVNRSTEGIANEIGKRLTNAGLQAAVRPVSEIEAIETYEAVVLGSAIHNMSWLPPAAAFVRTHIVELASRPVWLFSVSSVGDTSSFFGPRVARFMRQMRKEPKEIAGFRETIRPRDHRNFAGAIDRTHWSLVGNLFLKALGGRYGDHRDWRDIDAWADGIARQLRAARASLSG